VLLHYWRKRAYLKRRAREVIQCWRDLRATTGVTDISILVDFAFAHCICPDQIRAELIEVMKVVGSLRPDSFGDRHTLGREFVPSLQTGGE
jgi:hypothetical protein